MYTPLYILLVVIIITTLTQCYLIFTEHLPWIRSMYPICPTYSCFLSSFGTQGLLLLLLLTQDLRRPSELTKITQLKMVENSLQSTACGFNPKLCHCIHFFIFSFSFDPEVPFLNVTHYWSTKAVYGCLVSFWICSHLFKAYFSPNYPF